MDQKVHPESFAVKEVHAKSLPPLKMVAVPFSHKGVFICRFCGGKKCKHEDWKSYPKSAIKGLNSDWITPTILATQRPSSRIIKEYGIVDEFLKNGILSIYNLEEPGEHPLCGDGILVQSGFSYLPEEFYQHGIYFYNFGWKDLTTTTTEAIFKILKQMALSFKDGNKIAVHCHAGRGRTGMIIAAWLIFCEHYSAKDAIALFKSKRSNSLSKKSQQTSLYQLEKELNDAKFMFFKTPKYHVQDYVLIQKNKLIVEITEKTRHLPILIHSVLKRLSLCVKNQIFSSKMVVTAIFNVKDTKIFRQEWSTTEDEKLESLKGKINEGRLELSEITDPRLLIQLLLDFIDGFNQSVLSFKALSEIQVFIGQQQKIRDFIESDGVSSFQVSEFCILERVVRFFVKICKFETINDEDLQKALTRLSISLLLLRKKFDSNFAQRNLVRATVKDPAIEAVAKFLNLWIKDYQKDDIDKFNGRRSPIRINYEKLNTLMGSKTQDSPVKPNHNGVRLPKIEPGKKEEEQKTTGGRANSNQNSPDRRPPSPQQRLQSPLNFSKLPGSNPDICERLTKRQEALDQKIVNTDARAQFNGLVENFLDMNSSLQEMVIEQLTEINKASINKK